MNLQTAREKIIKFGKKDVKLRNKFSSKRQKNISTSFEEVANFDKITTAFLKKVIEQFGIPTISIFGKKACNFAWLIVQHTQDLDFQKEYLSLLKKQNPKEVSLKHIAYLEDRVNMYENKPQKYGTQFVYDTALQKFVPHTLLDEKNLDKYRKDVGLEPFETYAKRIK